MTKYLRQLSLLAALVSISGCATISTLHQPASERKPLIMSGARLDIASLRSASSVEAAFGASAPRYPLLDLPFSAFLDLLVLGYTVPVAIYYAL